MNTFLPTINPHIFNLVSSFLNLHYFTKAWCIGHSWKNNAYQTFINPGTNNLNSCPNLKVSLGGSSQNGLDSGSSVVTISLVPKLIW